MFMNETKFPTGTKSIKDNIVRQNLPLGANDSVIIKLKQGRTRKNFIEVTKSFRGQNTGWKYMDLPTLDVPEEAYNFVRALDEIIIACDGKKFCEYSNPNEELISLKLFTKFYDIFLNLLRDQEGRIFLEVLQKENGGMYRQFYIKIDALPWIRKTIAEILREYDDSEKLPPMPIKYINSNMFMMNQTNSGIHKEAIKSDLVLEKLQMGPYLCMNIKLEQGISGIKTIKITKIFRTPNTEWRWKFVDLPKLPVPEEAFKFVRALDEIIIACDGKKFCEYSS
uniref:Decapping nuclease n=1 Tax=Meloidogyne floridensis TaxID=298350 RepID=A0A915NUS2_9BILA